MPHTVQQLLPTWGSIKLCCHVCDVSLVDGNPDAQLLHLSTAVQILKLLQGATVCSSTGLIGVYMQVLTNCSRNRKAVVRCHHLDRTSSRMFTLL